MSAAQDFIKLCVEQTGEKYVYGAEVKLSDPNPPGPWDCSELVQWATYQLGVGMPDGSYNQLQWCRSHATVVSVEEAINTPGALLFMQTASHHHVAVSLGNGRTIEARGSAYGVGSWNAPGREWTHGGLVPGLEYGREEVDVTPEQDAILRDIQSKVTDARQVGLNLQSVDGFHQKIETDTLTLLQQLKDSVDHGSGAGDVDPAVAAKAIADELMKRLEA